VSSYLVYVVRVNFFSFTVYYRVLLLFLFTACQWHCLLWRVEIYAYINTNLTRRSVH